MDVNQILEGECDGESEEHSYYKMYEEKALT